MVLAVPAPAIAPAMPIQPNNNFSTLELHFKGAFFKKLLRESTFYDILVVEFQLGG